jgi:hypothetical protein
MPKEGYLESLIEIVSSIMVGKVLTDLDKKAKSYLTDFIRNVMKKLMLTVAGFAIAVVGLIFLFATCALYLNEFLNSTWKGWGIAGVSILIIGLASYALSRR